LQKYLIGHKIESVEVRLKKMLSGEPKDIIGEKIMGVRRFGKGLVIDLDNGYSIAIHIKLTGQLIYRGSRVSRVPRVSQEKVGTVPNKFTHVIFKLNRGGVLYYNDMRQFGWIKIVKTKDLKTISFFKDLGPEPLPSSGQAALTFEMFKQITSKSNLAIKPLIMDQKKIGGIGNIYANDGLFDAALDPRRKAKSLKPEEIKKLYSSLLKVLKKGLENGGASELNYVNALGQEGKYQHHFLAYARDGEKCVRCGKIMKKIPLGGRGTYFCKKCQK
jgi:formamidopyrimidine-DNA glycosylase